MNNLSSYCGLVDVEMRASDKDLPVRTDKIHNDSQVISHANNRLNARLVCLIAIMNDLSYFFFTKFLSWKNSFLIIVFEYLFKVLIWKKKDIGIYSRSFFEY